MNVSYRSIAKLLAKGMPVDGQEYSDIIEGYIKTLEAMPVEQQSALSAAYIFSDKIRGLERQDLFQELVAQTLTVLAKHQDRIPNIEGFCYKVAQNKWRDRLRNEIKRKEILNGGFLSLNAPKPNSDGQEVELQKTIVGEVAFERKLNSKLDCQAVLDTLPDKVKVAVIKRSEGRALSAAERNMLHRHIKQNGHKIREALAV